MSNDDKPGVDELLAAYASGDVSDEERAEVEQHLRESAAARQELAELEEGLETLRAAGTPRGVEPDWERMARMVEAEIAVAARAARPRWMWPAIAISLSMAAAMVLLLWRSDKNEFGTTSEPLRSQQIEVKPPPQQQPDQPGEPPVVVAPAEDEEVDQAPPFGDALSDSELLGFGWVSDWPELRELDQASDEELRAIASALDEIPESPGAP